MYLVLFYALITERVSVFVISVVNPDNTAANGAKLIFTTVECFLHNSELLPHEVEEASVTIVALFHPLGVHLQEDLWKFRVHIKTNGKCILSRVFVVVFFFKVHYSQPERNNIAEDAMLSDINETGEYSPVVARIEKPLFLLCYQVYPYPKAAARLCLGLLQLNI